MKPNRYLIAQALMILSVISLAKCAFAQGGGVTPLLTKDLRAAHAAQEGNTPDADRRIRAGRILGIPPPQRQRFVATCWRAP